MFYGLRFNLLCMACLIGVFTGALMVDGTFINFRGEQLRRCIEQLAEPEPAS